MKYLVLLVALVFISAIGKFGWDHFRRQQQALILSPSREVPQAVATSTNSMKDLIGAPLESGNLSFPIKSTSACQLFWRELLSKPLTTWFSETAAQGWNPPASCAQEEGSEVATVGQQIAPSCAQKDSLGCQTALLNYRTKLAAMLNKSVRNYVDMPISLLLTKMYDQVLIEGENTTSAADVLSMVENLVRREGNRFSVRKLVVAALYSVQARETDPELKNSYRLKLSTEIDQAKALQKGDALIARFESQRQNEIIQDDHDELELTELPETAPEPGEVPAEAKTAPEAAANKLDLDILNW